MFIAATVDYEDNEPPSPPFYGFTDDEIPPSSPTVLGKNK